MGRMGKSPLEMHYVLTDKRCFPMHRRFVLSSKSLILPLLFAGLVSLVSARTFELTPQQTARLQKFLPHSYPKLVAREQINAITLGDSVMDMYLYDNNSGNVLQSYAGLFLEQLGAQFYYTGGVLRTNARRNESTKILPVSGPEIRLFSGARGGKMMLHGVQSLTSSMATETPDVVLVSFGINDANFGIDLASYRRALQEIIETARTKGADVLLFGPSVVSTDPPEAGMALTPPYSSVMKEVADQNGLFYCDLGDLAWLVQVDERYESLVKPLPKKKAAEEPDSKADAKEEPKAEAKPGAQTPSPIQIPVPGELDPDTEKRAARFFSDVVKGLRQWFNHGATIDWIHPNSAAHRLLARRVYSELLDGPKEVPWAVGGGSVNLDGNGHCTAAFRIENTSSDTLRVVPLPLVTKGWKPVEAQPEIELKPAKRAVVTMAYQMVEPSQALPAGETFLRLPVLIVGSGMTRIEVIKAPISPVAVQWNSEARFNQSGTSSLGATIVNGGNAAVQGKWQATWLGQTFNGNFDLKPGTSAPVEIKLALPDAADPVTRKKGTLSFTVTAGAFTQSFDREVEISRNIGLKEAVPLYAPGSYVLNKPAAPDATGASNVSFRADADDKAFYLTWDLRGLTLHDNPDDGTAFFVEVNLDGRTYGKRLAPGATDALRVTSPAADGDARVSGLHPWSFGTGYVNGQDARAVQAKFSSKPDGSRRLTLMIPRSFLYLHEWALGNGNSQLGFNTTLSQWMPGDAGAAATFANWQFTSCPLHRDDASSLSVLELTDQPTRRWTVRLY